MEVEAERIADETLWAPSSICLSTEGSDRCEVQAKVATIFLIFNLSIFPLDYFWLETCPAVRVQQIM
jgi:hypothetical protein